MDLLLLRTIGYGVILTIVILAVGFVLRQLEVRSQKKPLDNRFFKIKKVETRIRKKG